MSSNVFKSLDTLCGDKECPGDVVFQLSVVLDVRKPFKDMTVLSSISILPLKLNIVLLRSDLADGTVHIFGTNSL